MPLFRPVTAKVRRFENNSCRQLLFLQTLWQQWTRRNQLPLPNSVGVSGFCKPKHNSDSFKKLTLAASFRRWTPWPLQGQRRNILFCAVACAEVLNPLLSWRPFSPLPHNPLRWKRTPGDLARNKYGGGGFVADDIYFQVSQWPWLWHFHWGFFWKWKRKYIHWSFQWY